MKKQRSSTLGRYLLSYLSVILIACAVIAEAVTLHSLREMHRQAENDTAQRLTIALNEIEEQYRAMQNVVRHISYEIYYRPIYVARNRYYELERIENFKKYESYSTLVSSYYLLYHGTEDAYGFNSKFKLDVLCQKIGTEKTTLQELMKKGNGTYIIADANGGKNIVFMISSHLSGLSAAEGDFSLLFSVSKDTLRTRIEAISGLEWNDYSLLYQDQFILSPDEAPEKIHTTRQTDQFSLRLHRDTAHIALHHFIPRVFTISGMLTILFLGFGCLAVYRVYKPIKRVADHFGQEEERDKLLSIERTITRLEKENSQTRINLNERISEIGSQKRQMRQQLLSMLFNGVSSADMQRQMEKADLHLPFPQFSVISLNWPPNQGKDGIWLEETLSSLRDEEIILYGLWRRQQEEYLILVNFSAPEVLDETLDILTECLETHGIIPVLRRSSIVYELRQLPISLISATPPAESTPVPSDCKREIDAELLYQALQVGDRQAALRQLHQMLEKIQFSALSDSLRHCRFIDLLNALLKDAESLGLQISENHIARAVSATTPTDFSAECTALVIALCESRNARKQDQENANAQKIVEYITSHITDPQLSIQVVADHFSIGARQVGRYVSKITGFTYKEWVARQKVELAKQLLVANNQSVEETSIQVCYANAAYFIKVFKEVTGVTPGQYKKNMQRDENDSPMNENIS